MRPLMAVLVMVVGGCGGGGAPHPEETTPARAEAPPAIAPAAPQAAAAPSGCNGRASCLAGCKERAPGACRRLVRAIQLGVVAGQPAAPSAEASAALSAACDAGDAALCGELAELHCTVEGNQLSSCQPTALALAKRSCDAGAAPGCFQLGMMHERGVLDLAQSDDDARPFYQKSLAGFEAECQAGDLRACLFAGGQHLQSRGAIMDAARAGSYFERAFTLGTTACEAGDPLACMIAAIAAGGSGHDDRVRDLVTSMCKSLEPADCTAWKAANPGLL